MAKLEIFDGTNWIQLGNVTGGNGIDILNVAGSTEIQQSNEYLANSGWKHNWFTSSVNVFSDRHTIKGIGYSSTDFVYLSRSVQTEKDVNGKFADWSNGISFDGDNGYYGISYLNTRTGLEKGFIYCYVSPLKISIGVDIDMNSSYKITNLANPTSTNDAATKGYADSLITTQLQNLSNIVTNGIMVRTGTSIFATRSLEVGSGLSITNANGVSGNPSINLTTQLQNLNNLNTLGFVTLTATGTGSSTFVNRTLSAGTGININNVNGVSGNPSISLGTVPISSLSGYPANSSLYLRGDGVWSSVSPTISLPLDFYTSTTIETGITIYNSNNSSTASSFRAINQNTGNGVEFGLNNSTSEGYVFASPTLSLKFGTNGIMRMKINTNGSIDCQSNNILTTGIINATTGTLKANNLAVHNSTSIVCDPLNISGGYFPYNGSYGYLNSSGSTGTASGSNSYSINCGNRVKASEFNAVSSIKKKHVLDNGVEVETEVINIIKNTEFFKYKYIDQIAEKGIRYGIIAEELSKTLPDYVDYDNMEYIPNIMQKGKLTQIAGGINNCKYILKLKDKIKISNEDKKLKLVDENNKVIEALILNVINKKTLEIKTEDSINRMKKTVFVYGTYEQCPSVASKVTELALIAVKNLLTRIEILEKRIYE